MKLIFKLLAAIVLAPIAIVLLVLVGIAAVVGLPLLWEQLVAKYTAPPDPAKE